MFQAHFEELKVDVGALRKTKHPDIRFGNVTKDIERVVADCPITEGIVVISVKHTTAAFVLNEDESGLIGFDFPEKLVSLCPMGDYKHDRAERILAQPGERKNAHSHLRSMVGGLPVLTLIIHNSRLQLGTWQDVLFFDFDPENRKSRLIVMQVMGVVA